MDDKREDLGGDNRPNRRDIAAAILRQIAPIKPKLVAAQDKNPIYSELLHPDDGKLSKRLRHRHRSAVYTTVMESLGIHLKDSGLKHDDLADAAGVDRTTVCKWLSGTTTIPHDKYLDLEAAFPEEFAKWAEPTLRQRTVSGYVPAMSFLHREVARSLTELRLERSISFEEFWFLLHAHKSPLWRVAQESNSNESSLAAAFSDVEDRVRKDHVISHPRTAAWLDKLQANWIIWFRVSVLSIPTPVGREARIIEDDQKPEGESHE